MAGKKGMTHYSKAIKLEAVRLHDEQGLTYAEVATRLEIRQARRIKKWYSAYRKQGEAAFDKQGGRPRKLELSEAERIAHLEMENALLKKFHTELRKLTLARRDIGSSSTTEETIP